MNLFLFLLIWAVLWFIPIPPRKFSWKALPRILSLFIGLFLFFIIQLFRTPLSIFVYWLIFLRLFVAFVESAFSLIRADIEDSTHYNYSHRRIPWRVSVKIQRKLVAILFLIYLLSASLVIVFGQIQRVSNATYFNSFIKLGSGYRSTVPFQTTWCASSQRNLPYPSHGDTCQSSEVTCES